MLLQVNLNLHISARFHAGNRHTWRFTTDVEGLEVSLAVTRVGRSPVLSLSIYNVLIVVHQIHIELSRSSLQYNT